MALKALNRKRSLWICVLFVQSQVRVCLIFYLSASTDNCVSNLFPIKVLFTIVWLVLAYVWFQLLECNKYILSLIKNNIDEWSVFCTTSDNSQKPFCSIAEAITFQQDRMQLCVFCFPGGSFLGMWFAYIMVSFHIWEKQEMLKIYQGRDSLVLCNSVKGWVMLYIVWTHSPQGLMVEAVFRPVFKLHLD